MNTGFIMDKIFNWMIVIALSILSFIALAPLLSVLATSFSSGRADDMNMVFLWPVEFNLDSWKYLIFKRDLWNSFGLTLTVTLVGTFLSLLITALLAYPLSKSQFKLGGIIMVAIVVTMIFKYPIVPYFLTIKSLGLYNSPLVLVVPHVLSAYNLAIMRTFFKQFPVELEEAAYMEGCKPFTVLFKIVLPASKAVLATLGLFYAVVFWNQFQHPLYFIQNPNLYPLQLKIRQYITDPNSMPIVGGLADTIYNDKTLKSATVVFAIIPIIMVYPYLQKYFVKGAMLGAVKG